MTVDQVRHDDTAEAELTEVFDGLWARHGGPEVLASAEKGTWPTRLWNGLAEAELPWVSVPEHAGGAGGTLADGCAVWRSVGRTACPLPVGETALAGWLLAAAGLTVPRAPLSVFPNAGTLRVTGKTLSGVADRVPWATEVAGLVGLVPGDDGLSVVLVPAEGVSVRRSHNLAGEPRDEVEVTGLPLDGTRLAAAPDWLSTEALRQRGALMRAQQMVGAMFAAVARTVAYTSERSQFGRPIGQFQAVAHLAVQAAAEATLAGMAVEVAALALRDRSTADEVAAAKVVAGEAVDVVTACCHQVHGAIGMTQEYALQHWSRRLWSWRDEFGSTPYWRRRVGENMLRAGADGLWPALAADPTERWQSGGAV
jgi:acyl-CoA dehydrogenase